MLWLVHLGDETSYFWLAVEVDEDGERHENSWGRIVEIATALTRFGQPMPLYVLRINADGLCQKKQHSDDNRLP